MNRVQVVLSGFSVRLLCFVHAKTFIGPNIAHYTPMCQNPVICLAYSDIEPEIYIFLKLFGVVKK